MYLYGGENNAKTIPNKSNIMQQWIVFNKSCFVLYYNIKILCKLESLCYSTDLSSLMSLMLIPIY